jgi:hypothetical protein
LCDELLFQNKKPTLGTISPTVELSYHHESIYAVITLIAIERLPPVHAPAISDLIANLSKGYRLSSQVLALTRTRLLPHPYLTIRLHILKSHLTTSGFPSFGKNIDMGRIRSVARPPNDRT